jgi:hypothetical protein
LIRLEFSDQKIGLQVVLNGRRLRGNLAISMILARLCPDPGPESRKSYKCRLVGRYLTFIDIICIAVHGSPA